MLPRPSRADEDGCCCAYRSAEGVIGHTRPNPPVGAAIMRGSKVVGEGAHLRAGSDHAEVAAIKAAGKAAKGATLYVTLEPCSRPGRVGACTDAIIAAGIKRVVWLCKDPNPKNRNRAKRILTAAGIKCECWEEDVNPDTRGFDVRRAWVTAAKKLIVPFAKSIRTGLPFVSVKIAMSLDGKICDNTGSSRWISSARARSITGYYRSCVDAIMVGAETVRKDNPSLLSHQTRNDDLWRVIISKSGKLPKNAKVFTDKAKDRTLVYSDPVEAIKDLGKRGFLHVLCEGGLKLAASLAEANMVDEWITVLAPIVIGSRPIKKAVKFKSDSLIQDYFCASTRNGIMVLG